jgi:hypothetical protein
VASEQENPRGWLVEPLDPDAVRIHVDVGEGVEVSDEFRGALDTLMSELYENEVEGFAMGVACGSLRDCTIYTCRLGKCQPLDGSPCFIDMQCKIQKIF